MQVAGNAIENDAGQVQRRVERFEAKGHGPDTARSFGGIDHQHHWQTEQFGKLGRTARLIIPVAPSYSPITPSITATSLPTIAR